MNYHLIVGYGKWAKKNLLYLKNKRFFKSIIVKTRKNFINFPINSVLEKKELPKILNKINSVHICTPLKYHFSHLKQFNSYKKIIIEKPFLNDINQLTAIKKIYKKNYLLVNYIDTFNPLIKRIEKSCKSRDVSKILLNYSDNTRYYKNKNEWAIEWLDHPLSLILLLFKKFPNFVINKNRYFKKNEQFKQKITLNYDFDKFNVEIRFNHSSNKERNLQLHKNEFIETFNFIDNSYSINQKKILKSKRSSFDNLYNFLRFKKKIDIQNFEFHKKIILQRKKILRKLKAY